jgi:hypothetical protein
MCGARSPYHADASAPNATESTIQEKRILLDVERQARDERTMTEFDPNRGRRFGWRRPPSRSELLILGIAFALLGMGTLVTGVVPSRNPSHYTTGFSATLQSIGALAIGAGLIYFAIRGIGTWGMKNFRKDQSVQSMEELIEYCEKNNMPKQAAEIRAQLEEMKNSKDA